MNADQTSPESGLIDRLLQFPMLDAVLGRRSRRFGLGMEIADGPLAYKSPHRPVSLSEFEERLLLAVGIGVSGWQFGITRRDPHPELATYSLRYGGRTLPTAAGIGVPEMIYWNDRGTYLVRTRDLRPNAAAGATNPKEKLCAMVQAVAGATTPLLDRRLELPRRGPHISEHNLWNASTPGSTVFAPITDVAQQMVAFLAVMVSNGYTLFDDRAGRPAGDLDPYFKTGLIDPAKRLPISFFEQYVLCSCATELGIVNHNIALVAQGLGIGGWQFTGINPLTVMGAFAGQGIPGLGFRIQTSPDWAVPNPVGLDGLFEAWCPPYVADMRRAQQRLHDTKFGLDGTYTPTTPGPFADNPGVKATAEPYTDEFNAAMGVMMQYVHETYGKFPGTVPTLYMRTYYQAHYLDPAFYDKFYGADAYLPQQARRSGEVTGGGAEP